VGPRGGAAEAMLIDCPASRPTRRALTQVWRLVRHPRNGLLRFIAGRRTESMERFLARLEAAVEPEWMLRPYVATAMDEHASMDPRAAPREGRVVMDAAELSRTLELLNSYSRRLRRNRYAARIASGWRGLRIVSEGDSWFQFPLLLEDIIDHLAARHAVFSLGKGGDTLSTIYAERHAEIFPALEQVQPHCFLISGGGNDMVRDGGLAALVRELMDSVGPEDHLHENLEDFIADLLRCYRLLFEEIAQHWPKLPILFHGYDRPIPRDDIWLGQPLAHRGIQDAAMQRAVIAAIMDRYNEALAELARELRQRPERPIEVHHVDCRGAIRDHEWADPMHPDDYGFARAACLVDRKIKQLIDTGVIRLATA